MKPNQKNRHNGRYNNRNSRSTITRNTALESSGPMGKVHGTALQLFEKYQAAAKDALIQNDLVLSQTYMQYADHYMRMQNIAIANETTMRQNIQDQQRQQPTLQNSENEQLKSEMSGLEKVEDASDSIPHFDVPETENKEAEKTISLANTEVLSVNKKAQDEKAKQSVSESKSVKQKKPIKVVKKTVKKATRSTEDMSVPIAQMQDNI
ncbi:MAG: DUF4167 domain-containing protein [Alphaproteobacteria bacterium]|nr:DUF4167 domain-containing protein [Alphaproteobacteria bacterium]